MGIIDTAAAGRGGGRGGGRGEEEGEEEEEAEEEEEGRKVRQTRNRCNGECTQNLWFKSDLRAKQ